MAADLYKFTPALEKPENLQKLLVGRESLLKGLLQAIQDAGRRKGIQHFLLIGPRGIGKTHMLLLLYHSVAGTIKWDESFKNLPKPWEAILLSEEQYSLGSLAELLIAILEHLSKQEPNEKLTRLLARMKEVWTPGEAERETILEFLLTRRNKMGKRLLLLVDNLQLILDNFSEEDQGRLRDILMSKDIFMIIGSAPTLFDAVLNYEAPFYNFFEIIWLYEIAFDEIETLLKKRLEHDGNQKILEKFDEYRPRVRAIVHLTGGNPRLILSLYQILSQGEVLEVERALLKLLDELTPYFQDRMNGLSSQQRKIIETMALMEGLSTPTEIAQAAHLEVNVVTSQLKRLQQWGYVRIQKEKGKREALYDISDQLFRLWRQMRVEAGRRRLGFIVKFLNIWFTEQELIEYAKKIVKEMMTCLDHAKYAETREVIDKLYYFQEAAPASMRSFLHSVRVTGLAFTGDLVEAEREIQERKALAKTAEDKAWLAEALNNLGVAYGEKSRYDQAIASFRKSLDLKPDKYEVWYNLGIVYADKGEYDQAIKNYRKALELKLDIHQAWYNLGRAYANKGEYDRAIEVYRKALELKPDKYEAWNNLGLAYAQEGKYDQAIEAFRRTLELKPDEHAIWYNFGQASVDKGEYNQAIAAYTRAIEIAGDGNFVVILYLSSRSSALGKIGKKAQALQDVETAYQLSIKLKDEQLIREHALYLFVLYLDLSQEKAHEGNEKQALEHYQKALDHLLEAPKERTQDYLTLYFKELFNAKALRLIEKALDLIEATGDDWAELLRPYHQALHYLKTKDKAILNRLFPEIREIVEQMVAQVEGGTGTQPSEESRPHPKARKQSKRRST